MKIQLYHNIRHKSVNHFHFPKGGENGAKVDRSWPENEEEDLTYLEVHQFFLDIRTTVFCHNYTPAHILTCTIHSSNDTKGSGPREAETNIQ